MKVTIQEPNSPQERLWEQTRWVDPEDAELAYRRMHQENALIHQGDVKGFIQLRQQWVTDNPSDIGSFEDLAEALIMAQRWEAVIALLTPVHDRWPERESVQRLLLEALFALGRSERDFPWKQRIPVLRLGPKVVDLCHQLVFDVGGLQVMGQLCEDLSYHGYLAFGWQELGRFLSRLGDFSIHGSQRRLWSLWVELPDVRAAEEGLEAKLGPV